MVQENGVPVGMKHYPAEFKADAVALYRSRPGATIKSVAGDLGVNTETLRNWIRAADGRRSGSHTTPRAAGPAESTSLEDEERTPPRGHSGPPRGRIPAGQWAAAPLRSRDLTVCHHVGSADPSATRGHRRRGGPHTPQRNKYPSGYCRRWWIPATGATAAGVCGAVLRQPGKYPLG